MENQTLDFFMKIKYPTRSPHIRPLTYRPVQYVRSSFPLFTPFFVLLFRLPLIWLWCFNCQFSFDLRRKTEQQILTIQLLRHQRRSTWQPCISVVGNLMLALLRMVPFLYLLYPNIIADCNAEFLWNTAVVMYSRIGDICKIFFSFSLFLKEIWVIRRSKFSPRQMLIDELYMNLWVSSIFLSIYQEILMEKAFLGWIQCNLHK